MPARRPSGYTLLELLIACSVLAIVSAVTLPKFDTGRWKADAAQRTLRGALQQAQRLAIQNQFDVVVGFDTTNGRIRIAEDSTNDRRIQASERRRWVSLEPGARFATPPAAAPETVGDRAVAGTTIDEVDGLPSITFYRNGAASSDAGVYLRTTHRGRDDLRAVTVVQSTGRTAAWRWRGTAWEDARP